MMLPSPVRFTIDQVTAKPTQARERALLVGSGEPTVSDDVRHQDRDQLAGLAHRRAQPSVNRMSLDLSERWLLRRWVPNLRAAPAPGRSPAFRASAKGLRAQA